MRDSERVVQAKLGAPHMQLCVDTPTAPARESVLLFSSDYAGHQPRGNPLEATNVQATVTIAVQ